jgi:hypothetical protein
MLAAHPGPSVASPDRCGEAPPAGAPQPHRPLTVGMATYDDFDGAYFTATALRLYHPEVADRVSLVVVDNNPLGSAAWSLKALEEQVQGLRYVPAGDVRGTAVRDRVFREANSDWVLCVDAHVLLDGGALARLLDFVEANQDCRDLLQGPLLDGSNGHVATHWAPAWRDGMFGTWATDERGVDPDAPPFEIPMQGLGLFACRTDAWPGLNAGFRGFGGEEGYLHEKFRAAGRRTVCLPFLRWVHRFARPGGAPYEVRWEDRIRNYLLGWEEVGLPTQPILDHFCDHLGTAAVEGAVRRLETERAHPFSAFDAIFCINLDRQPDRWARMRERFEALGVAQLVRRFPAIDTPENHHVGCALSHRRIIEEAKQAGLESVLVLEDDVVFLEGTTWVLRRSLKELGRRAWNIFYLGGALGRRFPRADGCVHLEVPTSLTTTHALAYHRRVYDRILADVPGDMPALSAWIGKYRAIDQYLAIDMQEDVFLASPVVASQESLVSLEDPALRDQFPVARP